MSHALRERWFCVNCQTAGELSIHSRCATYDSDAVVSLDAQHLNREAREVEELEAMLGMERMA